MAEFLVDVTITSNRKVLVEATSVEDAEQLVSDMVENRDYEVTSDPDTLDEVEASYIVAIPAKTE